jgi:NitT/TauT family transport system substrate-binding protein
MIERFLKKPRKISSFLKTILLFGLIGLLGCSDLKKENNQTTLLLDWFANPNHVPIYAGISKGFFQEENISLNIKKIFDPSDSIPYLTSNQTDLAIYYMPQTIRAQSKGANLKVIGSLIDKPLNCILYRKDSSINTIEDLEGKTIGYAMASLNTLQLQKLCIEKKITPKETICLSTDLVAAISTGRVDATLGCYKNIESQQLLAMGVETGSFPIQILGIPEFEELVILANSIKGQDKNFITRFKRAMQKSIDFCKNNPQEAFELYTHQNPDKMQNTISWEEKAWQLTYPLFSISQDFNKNKWQDFSNWMFNNGLIINNVSAETLNPL